MLNRCKKWIASRLGSRRPSRRRAASQFRGRLEALETRNVLSATIGVVTYDVVAVQIEPTSVTIVAVAEYHPMASFAEGAAKFVENREAADGSLMAFGPLSAHAPHFDPLFESQFRSTFEPPTGLQRFVNLNSWSKSGTSAGQGGMLSQTGSLNHSGSYGGNNTIEDIEARLPQGDPAGEFKLPQRASTQSDSTTPSDPSMGGVITNDGTTTTGNYPGATNWSPPPRPQYFSSNRGLQAAFLASNGNEPSEPSVQLAVETRDLAIEDFTSNSLLLAANFDVDAEDGTPGDGDDDRGALGATDEDADDSKNEAIAADLAESLDALQREQAAVDAVLAELHNINLAEAKSQASSEAHRTTNADMRELAERFFVARPSESAQSPYDASAGGMVLLAATGDANSSAFELITPAMNSTAGNSIASLAPEAPVGLYQAIDIGVRPAQTTAAENVSIAEPPAKVQTSAATENAPAKKSEQPS